jgi:protein-tyrosine phosphatase
MKRIVFVCHGNICRSVAAEYICKDFLRGKGLLEGFDIISRATSREEIGNDIYPPMKRELLSRGIPLEKHRATQITQQDYESADAILYMDEENRYYLDRMLNDHKRIIRPIFYLSPEIDEIEDPWYSGRFGKVVNEITVCLNDIFDKGNLFK